MTSLFLRTLLIYLVLTITMRLMGKRQIAQLEITDLVTTILISEIASLPVTDSSIPLSHAVVPILSLLTFEVLTSYLLARHPKIKGLLSARPAILIQDGILSQQAMRKARISADELISELRQQGVSDPAQVRYAILEQNGRISVILYQRHQPITPDMQSLQVEEEGLFHILIDKGVTNTHSMKELKISRKKLGDILKKERKRKEDVYLMLVNDEGAYRILPTESEPKKKQPKERKQPS